MKNYKASFLLLTAFYSLNVIGIRGFVVAPPVLGLEWWFGIVLLVVSVLLFVKMTKLMFVISWLILMVWTFIQFRVHWKWLLESVTKSEINWYNRVFGNNYRWLSVSETKFIPDNYHLLLHLLILLCVILGTHRIVKSIT